MAPTAETTISALFRVDAGYQVGLGHLRRCLSLASALQRFGVHCVFLTNEEPRARDCVRDHGFQGYTLDGTESWGENDLGKTVEIATSNSCVGVVVDSDYEGFDYLGVLREAGLFVCAVEDLAPHSFPCQLVVNGDAHAEALPYRSSSRDTMFLLGPEYAILRSEFWEVAERGSTERVGNVLVTFGGADGYDLTPRVLNLLKTLPESFSVTAIIGPFFKNVTNVEAAIGGGDRPIELVRSPKSVYDLMVKADLAISAGGQTLYELARVGCPTIAVGTAANQDGQIRVFEESGFVRVAGRADDEGVVKAIADEVVELLFDAQARGSMSAAGQRLIDGQGALRVAGVIVRELHAASGKR